MIIYVYSKFSPLSVELFGDVKKIPDVTFLCIDSPKIRKLITQSQKLKIQYVPSIIEISGAQANLYEGSKAQEWVNDILQQLMALNSRQAPPPYAQQPRYAPPAQGPVQGPSQGPSQGVTDVRNLPPEDDDPERLTALRPPGPSQNPLYATRGPQGAQGQGPQPYVPTTLLARQPREDGSQAQQQPSSQPLVLTRAPIAASVNPTEFDRLSLDQKRAAMLGESTGGGGGEMPSYAPSRGGSSVKDLAAQMASERDDLDLTPAELGRRMMEQQSQGIVSPSGHLVPGSSGPPPGGYGTTGPSKGAMGRAYPANRRANASRIPNLEEIQ
jgi:hypothetical protein